jgi:hypothetical protein
MAVRWNADDYRWDLEELREFQRNSYEPRALREDEELNRANLDSMKNAIEELKIVDVVRKPAGLRPTGQTDTPIWQDMEALQSLQEHGFYAQQAPDDGLKLYCSDGEVDLRTKDGVEYTLWFGSQAATVDSAGDSRIDRYVMISAQVDAEAFEKPVLELPPESSSTPIPQDAENEEAPSNETEETPAAADVAKDDVETAKTAAVDSQRDRLLQEYERKLDEYNEKVKKAEAAARDLNMRLGDWYFVVSEDVYNKIRLRRSQIMQQKESVKQEDGTGVEAFRALQDAGVVKEAESPAAINRADQ